ncbi:MAG: hypothetical protein EXQ60_05855 [Candidatus Nanopelagicales bacterium]|nr:hypothetical protein [Candidatus Nanopelagicales bacterium]
MAASAIIATALVVPSINAAQAAPKVTVVKSIPESGSQTVKVPAGNNVRFRVAYNTSDCYGPTEPCTYSIATLKNTAKANVGALQQMPDPSPAGGSSYGAYIVFSVVPKYSGITVIQFTCGKPVSKVRLKFMN